MYVKTFIKEIKIFFIPREKLTLFFSSHNFNYLDLLKLILEQQTALIIIYGKNKIFKNDPKEGIGGGQSI